LVGAAAGARRHGPRGADRLRASASSFDKVKKAATTTYGNAEESSERDEAQGARSTATET